MEAVAEHIKVPELRFPEFSGEWEKKRLGELLEFFPTNSLSRKQLNLAGTGPHIIHYGDIHTKYPAVLNSSNRHIPRAIHDDVKGTPCKDGDLLIADASEDYGDIGKAIEVVNTTSRIIFGGLHVIHARAVEGTFAITFLTRLFQSEFVRKEIQRRANGATVLGISYKQVQLIEPLLPSLPEQQKIAEFLTAVDEKIGKLKRKKELLEAYKKGAMQKMFVSSN